MKVWQVDEGFILNEDAPAWATKVAWRICKTLGGDVLVRAWVDEDNTKYKYLRGYSGFNDHWSVLNKDFFDKRWTNRAHVFARLVEAEPMVCHDQYGDMTDAFRKYSQPHWDNIREMANEVIRQAIRDGVNPIAMKELMQSAIDCGVTMAKVEARVEDYSNKMIAELTGE